MACRTARQRCRTMRPMRARERAMAVRASPRSEPRLVARGAAQQPTRLASRHSQLGGGGMQARRCQRPHRTPLLRLSLPCRCRCRFPRTSRRRCRRRHQRIAWRAPRHSRRPLQAPPALARRTDGQRPRRWRPLSPSRRTAHPRLRSRPLTPHPTLRPSLRVMARTRPVEGTCRARRLQTASQRAAEGGAAAQMASRPPSIHRLRSRRPLSHGSPRRRDAAARPRVLRPRRLQPAKRQSPRRGERPPSLLRLQTRHPPRSRRHLPRRRRRPRRRLRTAHRRRASRRAQRARRARRARRELMAVSSE